jgi:hypothetical protein
MRGLWKLAPVAVLAAAGIALGVSAGAGASDSRAPYINSSLHSTDRGVKFKPGVVKISAATVKHELVGISAKGVFEFKSTGGALGHLRKGKVVLLQGSDALVVTSVSRKHGKLFVSTKEADLTQVVSAGKFTFNGAPNWHDASAGTVDTGAIARRSASVFHAPSYPYVARRADLREPATAGTFTVQGSSGLFGYSLNFTPESQTKLSVSGTICVGTGSVCGNGPANGVDAELNVSGYIDFASATGGVDVSGGSVTGSDFDIKGLKTNLQVTYSVVRGDGSNGNVDPPVLHIPVGVDLTIPGEIPFYVKLQLGVLVKFGVTSKNSIINGGIQLGTSGSNDSVKLSGRNADGSESGDSVSGNFLDSQSSKDPTPPSTNVGPAGIVVAVQFPKIGFGLGYTSINGIAYVDVITSLGETAPGALDLDPCTKYVVDYSIGTGFEAQIGGGKFGLQYATPRKVLYPPAGTPDPTTKDCGSS